MSITYDSKLNTIPIAFPYNIHRTHCMDEKEPNFDLIKKQDIFKLLNFHQKYENNNNEFDNFSLTDNRRLKSFKDFKENIIDIGSNFEPNTKALIELQYQELRPRILGIKNPSNLTETVKINHKYSGYCNYENIVFSKRTELEEKTDFHPIRMLSSGMIISPHEKSYSKYYIMHLDFDYEDSLHNTLMRRRNQESQSKEVNTIRKPISLEINPSEKIFYKTDKEFKEEEINSKESEEKEEINNVEMLPIFK